jgi:Lon protease-like protein
MNQLLPYFPLGIVVFPGETANLHIFEPRYKQLINDCQNDLSSFGIPFVHGAKFSDLGIEVIVTKVISTANNGEMDIEIKGNRVFKIIDYRNPLPEKLYSGGTVEFVNFPGDKKDVETNRIFVKFLKSFLEDEEENFQDSHLLSYSQIAENVIQSQEEKYKFLCISSSVQMKSFLINYMNIATEISKKEKELENKFFLN